MYLCTSQNQNESSTMYKRIGMSPTWIHKGHILIQWEDLQLNFDVYKEDVISGVLDEVNWLSPPITL